MSGARAEQVAAELKGADPDRYYATLLIPEPVRPAVQALYAFNADVATIRERAKKPAPGEIRLQWWDDALSGEGHGDVRQNPVADALLSAIGEYGLPVAPLQRLIEARRFDLYDDPMPDLATFEGYAGETVSVLFQLAGMILNGGRPIAEGDAAGHLGVAQALAGHLSAFGHYAQQGRLFLPFSVLAANGVTEGEIFGGTPSEGLFEARGQLIEIAVEHLRKAEAAIKLLPKTVRPAFASLPSVRLTLRQVELSSTTPFEAPPPVADWRKIAAMTWWNWRG